MDNLDRLKRVVEEYRPQDTVIETDETFVVLDPDGLHIQTPDKSDDNVQWTIDLLTGQDPWSRNK